jgi:hypothetical protein
VSAADGSARSTADYDGQSAAAVEVIEARITGTSSDRAGIESVRSEFLAELERQYVGEDLRPCPTDSPAP